VAAAAAPAPTASAVGPAELNGVSRWARDSGTTRRKRPMTASAEHPSVANDYMSCGRTVERLLPCVREMAESSIEWMLSLTA